MVDALSTPLRNAHLAHTTPERGLFWLFLAPGGLLGLPLDLVADLVVDLVGSLPELQEQFLCVFFAPGGLTDLLASFALDGLFVPLVDSSAGRFIGRWAGSMSVSPGLRGQPALSFWGPGGLMLADLLFDRFGAAVDMWVGPVTAPQQGFPRAFLAFWGYLGSLSAAGVSLATGCCFRASRLVGAIFGLPLNLVGRGEGLAPLSEALAAVLRPLLRGWVQAFVLPLSVAPARWLGLDSANSAEADLLAAPQSVLFLLCYYPHKVGIVVGELHQYFSAASYSRTAPTGVLSFEQLLDALNPQELNPLWSLGGLLDLLVRQLGAHTGADAADIQGLQLLWRCPLAWFYLVTAVVWPYDLLAVPLLAEFPGAAPFPVSVFSGLSLGEPAVWIPLTSADAAAWVRTLPSASLGALVCAETPQLFRLTLTSLFALWDDAWRAVAQAVDVLARALGAVSLRLGGGAYARYRVCVWGWQTFAAEYLVGVLPVCAYVVLGRLTSRVCFLFPTPVQDWALSVLGEY